MRIALIGDYSDEVTAHVAIPQALALEAKAQNVKIAPDWLHTKDLNTTDLTSYDAGWVVPASPYADMDAVLSAIRHLRETDTPFLGTCGGYQHALVEFARNVLVSTLWSKPPVFQTGVLQHEESGYVLILPK